MAESNEKPTITEELKALREQLKEVQEARIQQYEARICQYEKQIETDGVWRTDMAMELKAVTNSEPRGSISEVSELRTNAARRGDDALRKY
ncbi:hypothetical protein JTE90_025554 [Oedothorax gibbosus]|uniref:Uncharacterized protein n=1 Tax=Oedothorax gibbosus TaxID=931172 RepID=A0AAV6TXA2_9ARAC|nr:hypothetical protein JTE90_025554 [Oedothorax gibbosus]